MKSTLVVALLLVSAGVASGSPNHVRSNIARQGDWCYEPSTYMEYDQALTLGKQQLAEQQAQQRPLGDIARELRAKKAQSQQIAPGAASTQNAQSGE